MALRRIPLSDLLSVTVRQPYVEQAPAGHCYISFRCGIMPRVNGKLTSDPRKGQLAIVKNEDGLVALQWYVREAKEDGTLVLPEEPEIDQLIFEFDGEFEWAKREKRFLKMNFKDDPGRNLFFWLQEPGTMWDDDLVSRLNKAIIGPHWKPATAPAPVQPASSATPADPAPAPSATAAAAPTQAPTASAAGPSTGAPLGNLLDMNLLLASMKAGGRRVQAGPSLSDVFSKDFLAEAMKHPECFDALKGHLPAEHQSQMELEALPRTAPFEQQLQGLSTALNTGRIDTTQFGIGEVSGVLAFLEAIQKLVDDEKRGQDGAADMDS